MGGTYSILLMVFSLCDRIMKSFHFLICVYLYGLNVLNQKTNKDEEPRNGYLNICKDTKFLSNRARVCKVYPTFSLKSLRLSVQNPHCLLNYFHSIESTFYHQ